MASLPSRRPARSSSRADARHAAREVLAIVPLVMRTVAAELRAEGQLPVPAHFPLLTLLARGPSTVSALAQVRGVSLPTMSNSVSALIKRGWVRRTPSPDDRRVIVVEATPAGRATVERIGRAAERRLGRILAPLDPVSTRRLLAGLSVLRAVFAEAPACAPRRPAGRTVGRSRAR